VSVTQLHIHSGTAFLLALALAVLVLLHGWITRARRRTISSRLFGVFYGAWVFSMPLLPFEVAPPGSGVGLDPYWRESVNLVPLRTIRLYLESDLGRVAWENLLGNLLLLVPLGALGPWAWRKLDRWGRVLGTGLCVSLGIEALQFSKRFIDALQTTRSVDIDDVILNTAGVALGYALFVVVRAIGRALRRLRRKDG